MKKNLLKIDQNEKNSLLEMHRKRGYKTIVEDEKDLLGLLDKKNNDDVEDIGAWGWEDEDDDLKLDTDKINPNNPHTHDEDGDYDKKREEFFGSLSADDLSSDYDDFDQDFQSVEDVDISDEEFMEIYNTEMKEGSTKEKEKEKEKTKEKEKDKKRKNPFRDPNPGTEEDPRGEKKTKKLKEGKKVVRLTEDELVNLIKKMIND